MCVLAHYLTVPIVGNFTVILIGGSYEINIGRGLNPSTGGVSTLCRAGREGKMNSTRETIRRVRRALFGSASGVML